jgi:hypothetical protein
LNIEKYYHKDTHISNEKCYKKLKVTKRLKCAKVVEKEILVLDVLFARLWQNQHIVFVGQELACRCFKRWLQQGCAVLYTKKP